MSKKQKWRQPRKKKEDKMSYVSLYMVFALFLSCSNNVEQTEGKINCEIIDQLEKKYKSKQFEFKYINEAIPELEKKSKINSQAIKDIDGYHYKSDSLFYQDIKKWKKYFKCK